MKDAEVKAKKKVKVAVRNNLVGCHPFVSRTRKLYESKTYWFEEIHNATREAPLNIRVSKNTLIRTLRIMDAILRSLKTNGYEVIAGPKAIINDVSIGFSIREHSRMIKTRDYEAEQAMEEEYRRPRHKVKLVPSGLLTLSITNAYEYSYYRVRVNWGDRSKQRVEDLLPKFMAQLMEFPRLKKEKETIEERCRIAYEKEQNRRREEEKERVRKRNEILAEKARVNSLFDDARDWVESKELREYIVAKRAAHLAEADLVDASQEFVEWEQWALMQADRLDPLRISSALILDE